MERRMTPIEMKIEKFYNKLNKSLKDDELEIAIETFNELFKPNTESKVKEDIQIPSIDNVLRDFDYVSISDEKGKHKSYIFVARIEDNRYVKSDVDGNGTAYKRNTFIIGQYINNKLSTEQISNSEIVRQMVDKKDLNEEQSTEQYRLLLNKLASKMSMEKENISPDEFIDYANKDSLRNTTLRLIQTDSNEYKIIFSQNAKSFLSSENMFVEYTTKI
jgi:hypothetical protein